MLLEVKNLCFGYYRQPLCLKDINFSLAENKKILVLGSEGMGKSTLLLVLSGLEDSYFGEIKIDGKNAKEILDKEKGISLLPEKPILLYKKTIYENFEFLFSVTGQTRTREDLESVLAKFNIDRGLDTKVKKLDAFEQRKLALARSYLKKPKLLLLDDQYSGLDEAQAKELTEIYQKLFNNNNSTIFTIGTESYKKCKNLLKTLKFDEIFYIYDAKMQKFNSIEEFEDKKLNINTIKFSDGKYYNYGTYAEVQDKFFNIYFENRFISIEGEIYKKLIGKLKLKTGETEDIIITSTQELDLEKITSFGFEEMVKEKKIFIFSAIDGDRII